MGRYSPARRSGSGWRLTCKVSTSCWRPHAEFLHQVAAFLPRLLLALVVVAIGWLFAKAARFAIERSPARRQFHCAHRARRHGQFPASGGHARRHHPVFGLIAYWLVILATLMIAFNGLAHLTSRTCSAAWCCYAEGPGRHAAGGLRIVLRPRRRQRRAHLMRGRAILMPTCSAGLRAISS